MYIYIYIYITYTYLSNVMLEMTIMSRVSKIECQLGRNGSLFLGEETNDSLKRGSFPQGPNNIAF